MLAAKLFQLLSRSEIEDISLRSGDPPRALYQGVYKRISAKALTDDDILAVIAAMRGQEHVAGLADGRRWQSRLPKCGLIDVAAGYEGSQLWMSMKRAAGEAAVARSRAETPALPKAEDAQLGGTRRATSSHVWVPEAAPPDAAPPADGGARDPARQTATARSGHDASGAPAGEAGIGHAKVLEQPHAQPQLTTAHDALGLQASHHETSEPPPLEQAAAAPAGRRFVGDLLDDLLGDARERRASDMHVISDRPALFRIAGELVQQGEALPEAVVEQLVLARVPDGAKQQLETQGSCDFSLLHPAYGRFRANVSRQRTGLKLTARPIGEEIPTLEGLGLPASVAQALRYHQGLIVVTGPTGHGKTTTLAAIVGIINRETTHHVITVEDPIEYVHGAAKAIISQREVGTHTKTFQAALKGSLREDPDVIVVGELRDTETVRMALTASETGHLVISTMNTPSAAKTIERLIDLFPPGDQPQVRMTLAGGLRLIVSQRLLPTSDRTGLCAAAEVLPGSLPLWNLIRENRTYQIGSLQQRGKSLGIIRLDDSLAQLVRSGKTTLEIARDFAESPESFEALVAGHLPGQSQADLAGGQAPAAQKPVAPQKPTTKDLGKNVLSRATKLFSG